MVILASGRASPIDDDNILGADLRYNETEDIYYPWDKNRGWLGRAIVLGSFQCRGVLLLWHMVGQGPAVLTAGAGRMGCFLFCFHLIYPIFLF